MSHIKDFGKVAVLMGGPSAEREVSLNSGAAILSALQRQGVNAIGIDADVSTVMRLQVENFDRVFIALHGTWGEDGVIQGALQAIDMPFTGSDQAASAVAMNKVFTKQIWQAYGLPTAAYRILRSESDLSGLESELGLPLFIKPANEGSSVGVSKVTEAAGIEPAWRLAKEYGELVLAEQFIDGPEITIAILNGQALPPIRLEVAADFYDYHAKYESDDTRYHCPSGLSQALESELQQLAVHAFDVIGATGWGRVDLLLDDQQRPYLLELNMVPGMTDHSLVPMAAKQAGLSFDDLVIQILETSL